MLQLMAAPLVACIVLLGIHVYLGAHVIQRKVIFVDLALAQIAALGATMAFLLGIDPHSVGSFAFSLAFAVGGAAVFTVTRMRRELVPQEAVIGIVYVVALATAILIADRAPEGAEHIKETLVGSILWVRWPVIVKTALLYVVIGAVHFVLRKRLLQISFEPERAYAEKRWIGLWDFVFYTSFAIVITSAVAIAGVLLVFSFLVIPAAIASLYKHEIGPRLVLGWIVGIAACTVGLAASYRFDTPSGPTVVAALGLSFLLAGLLRFVMSARSKSRATLKILAVVGVVGGLVAALSVFFTTGESLQIPHSHESDLSSTVEEARHAEDHVWNAAMTDCLGDAACAAAEFVEAGNWAEIIAHRLEYGDAIVRERAAEVAAAIGTDEALELLAKAVVMEPEPLLRLNQATLLAAAGNRKGLEVLVTLLTETTPLIVREEAHAALLESSGGTRFGYDPTATVDVNAEAIARWRRWVIE